MRSVSFTRQLAILGRRALGDNAAIDDIEVGSGGFEWLFLGAGVYECLSQPLAFVLIDLTAQSGYRKTHAGASSGVAQ